MSLSGGRVSRGHNSGTWSGEGSKSMSLYRRLTLTREHGCSICVWPEGHKFMSHCGRCPLQLVEVTKAVRSQWLSKINQCPFIGDQQLPDDTAVQFVCGQRATNYCPSVGDVPW